MPQKQFTLAQLKHLVALNDRKSTADVQAGDGGIFVDVDIVFDSEKHPDAAAFHQHCNSIGPNFIICHVAGQPVTQSICGGYTDINWMATNGYHNRAAAYLFQIDQNSMQKHICTSPANAVYTHPNGGPCFGAGHDLRFFIENNTWKVALAKNSYNTATLPLQSNTFCNFVVVEAAALVKAVTQYANVTPGKALDEEIESNLKEEIKDSLENIAEVELSHGETSEANVLLLGSAGSGKSSFLKTLDALFMGRLSRIVDAGTGTDQCTDTLEKINLEPKTNKLKKRYDVDFPEHFQLCFWDTMGWSDQAYLHGELGYILDGNIPDMFKFDRQGSITPDSPGFIKDPKFKDKAHVVVLVLSVTQACTEKSLARVKEILVLTRRRGIRSLLLLTQIDELDPKMRNSCHLVDQSEKIQAVIKKVTACGIPESDIFPMKNYVQEKSVSTQVEYLLCKFLESLAYCCEDYFRATKKRQAKMPATASRPPTYQGKSSKE